MTTHYIVATADLSWYNSERCCYTHNPIPQFKQNYQLILQNRLSPQQFSEVIAIFQKAIFENFKHGCCVAKYNTLNQVSFQLNNTCNMLNEVDRTARGLKWIPEVSTDIYSRVDNITISVEVLLNFERNNPQLSNVMTGAPIMQPPQYTAVPEQPKLNTQVMATKYCAKCGSANAMDANFCPKCGAAVKE